MAIKTQKRLWTAALALALAAGCNSGGGNATGGPTPMQKTQSQTADAASRSISQTQDAANNALVENGAPGATKAQSGAPSGASAAAGVTINFQASVNVTVDLDMLNSSGQDAFPNASGKFTVAATGSVTGTGTAGQATYAVQITWVTDGVFTDPVSGDSATVAAGSNWSYSLAIQWTKTDDLNWSISATSDVSGALSATVVSGLKTCTVTGTVDRHADATFSCTAGTDAFTFGINGQRTLVVTDGVETHTVVVTTTALDHILIDVDGVVFGPYSLAQILFWFAFDCNG